MIPSSAILWALAAVLVSVSVIFYRKATYWSRMGVPCVSAPPVIGIMWRMLTQKLSATDLVLELYNSHPGSKYVGTMDLGFLPLMVVNDPEIVKDMAVKNFDHFTNHQTFADDEFDPIMSKNIFSLKDDRWREMRSTLSPSFTANKMKYMFRLVSQCSTDFVEYLCNHDDVTKEMDLTDVFTRYTNDVIATAAFGVSVNSMKDRDNDFYTYGKDAASFAGFFKMLKFIASRFFPKLMGLLGVRFLSSKTDRFFKTLINDTVTLRKEKGIVRPDMIHLLMQARDNEKGIELTTDDIIAQAFIFFLAGFDTSARLMCFVSHVLAHHPDVQEKLRDEVDSALKDDGDEVSYETLSKMKYLDMVVSETLRLYSPSPFTDRVCNKAYTLPPSNENSKPFVLEPGTVVWFPAHGFHTDPNYFPNPKIFDPERFNDDNKNDIKPYT